MRDGLVVSKIFSQFGYSFENTKGAEHRNICDLLIKIINE